MSMWLWRIERGRITPRNKEADLRWTECKYRAVDRSSDTKVSEPLLDQEKPDCMGETTK